MKHPVLHTAIELFSGKPVSNCCGQDLRSDPTSAVNDAKPSAKGLAGTQSVWQQAGVQVGCLATEADVQVGYLATEPTHYLDVWQKGHWLIA